MTERICGNCAYWQHIYAGMDEGEGIGECEVIGKSVMSQHLEGDSGVHSTPIGFGCNLFETKPVPAGPFKAWEVPPTTGISFEPQSTLPSSTGSVYSVSVCSVATYAGMQRLAEWLNERWTEHD